MAENEYVNKVVFKNTPILDLSNDTVTSAVLTQGYTAHDASGAPIVGTNTGGGGDMYKVNYDPQSAVSNAGGIPDYVDDKINDIGFKQWVNVTVSSSGWIADSTVSGYSYKQILSLSGCTADMTLVVFGFPNDEKVYREGNTIDGGLEIWSNDNTLSTTIPLIKRLI